MDRKKEIERLFDNCRVSDQAWSALCDLNCFSSFHPQFDVINQKDLKRPNFRTEHVQTYWRTDKFICRSQEQRLYIMQEKIIHLLYFCYIYQWLCAFSIVLVCTSSTILLVCVCKFVYASYVVHRILFIFLCVCVYSIYEWSKVSRV